jgi:hypothetical protein
MDTASSNQPLMRKRGLRTPFAVGPKSSIGMFNRLPFQQLLILERGRPQGLPLDFPSFDLRNFIWLFRNVTKHPR